MTTEWFEKYQKETKGKTPEWNLGDEKFTIEELYTHSGKNLHFMPTSCRSLEWVLVDSVETKSTILAALEGGAGGIYLSFQPKFNLATLQVILEGIFPEMVFLLFDLSNTPWTLNEFQQALPSGFEKIEIIHPEKDGPSYLEHSPGWEAEWKEKLKSKSTSMVFFKPSRDFIFSVAMLRSLKELLKETSSKLIVLIELEKSENFHLELVPLTLQAILAQIGGADYFCVCGPHLSLEERKLVRNITEILHLESGFNQARDFLKGSRSLEYLIEKIKKEIMP